MGNSLTEARYIGACKPAASADTATGTINSDCTGSSLSSRNQRRARCERCQRPSTHCLCGLIPCLSSRTRVVVLQHPDESRHAMNTARLAVLGLSNAQLHVGTEFDAALWQIEGYQPRLLFPGEGAEVLMPGKAIDSGSDPTLLVVPDGTWRQARQLLAQHPMLAALPRVTLPEGTTARYRIRHADVAGALSTIEAIALSLNALNAPQNFDALLAPFEALIAGQIAAMGQERYVQHHVLREGSRAQRKRE
jgi:DTW domain-containing protein YfiP